MSKFKIFNVYDSKVGAYSREYILFARSLGEALRSWESVCNDGKSMMSSHPADFTLFEVAEYDENSGRFEMLPALKSVATALEVKKVKDAELPLDAALKAIKR